MKDHIFISYSHKDKSYVEKLAKTIEKKGFSTWTDNRLQSGENWPHVLQQRIDKCVGFVVVMSPDAGKSRWVSEELQQALEQGKTIIPLLLAGEGPVFSLKTVHFLDVRGSKLPPEEFYETLSNCVLDQREINANGEIEQEKRNAALRKLQDRKKTAFVCSKCKFPVPYDTVTVTAMVFQLGLPFIGGAVTYYLWGWLGAAVYFLVSLVGMSILISKNENVFMEPSICPACGCKLEKPLRIYNQSRRPIHE